ncbi:hypothetical protein CEP54_014098 [Fusarium duplospermum]|uniref:Uncharacterized protein n=1 Tax=Fusarium duplospermum TaxID=1325734 RepID=A0A428NYG7_9HYPO|nr:hypothetical protein CEP54_014098 [Fusarium duplospermum]
MDNQYGVPSTPEGASAWHVLCSDKYNCTANGKCLDDLEALPESKRHRLLRQCLVETAPLVIRHPIYETYQQSIHCFRLLKERFEDTSSGQRLIQEARRIFYEENSFVVFWAGLNHFLEDILGHWTNAISVKLLVRRVTVKVGRHECPNAGLAEVLSHFSALDNCPNLESISFEWWGPPRLSTSNLAMELERACLDHGSDSEAESDQTLRDPFASEYAYLSDGDDLETVQR